MSQPTLNEDLNVVSNSNLEITYLDGDLNIIQKLDDEPNDVGGLTSAELKAKFDEAGNTIKTYLNETLIPELLAADATEAERAEAETARETAEEARSTAETGRGTAESARVEAETERASAETARIAAETSRTSAETARDTAEAARISAEATRQTQEDARQSAESSRSESETARASAESDRAAAEALRQANESARQSAETGRISAETSRAAAEDARSVWESYDSSHAYVPGNKVTYLGSSYLNTAACTGVLPTYTDYWMMIASKGEDGQGAGDMLKSVYDPAGAVEQIGGIVAYVAEETSAADAHLLNKTNPHEVTAAQVGAAASFYKVFAASAWTSDGTLTIPVSEHGLVNLESGVMCQISVLSDGVLVGGTWAEMETYATVDSSKNVILHGPTDGYAGAVLLIG